jgi:hypothetical protein
VVKGGHEATLSATRFARLAGVSRERLRTWERRHGFPQPTRTAGGPRRYADADLPRVIAVRRAVEAGVPLPAAIGAARAAPLDGGTSDDAVRALAAVVERLPGVCVLLSGPAPLRLTWRNAHAYEVLGERAVPGVDLLDLVPAWRDSASLAELQAAFVAEGALRPLEHPPWGGHGGAARSLPVRVPGATGRPPLVALVGTEGASERELSRALAAAERRRERAEAQAERRRRGLALLAEVADEFAAVDGRELLDAALDALVRGLGAIDAAIAPYMTGQLVLGSSLRGRLGPEVVEVAAHPELLAVLRGGGPRWLEPPARAELGGPGAPHLLAAPARTGGQTLAVLLVACAEPDLDEDGVRVAGVVASGLALAMLRDRLQPEHRAA